MFTRKTMQILSLSFILLILSYSGIFGQNKKYDVVIYGGTLPELRRPSDIENGKIGSDH
jgi:hypothetical protein